MFRKNLIRLALLMILVSFGLIVFAAVKVGNQASNQSCEVKTDCAPEKASNDFYILETLGRSILSSSTY